MRLWTVPRGTTLYKRKGSRLFVINDVRVAQKGGRDAIQYPCFPE